MVVCLAIFWTVATQLEPSVVYPHVHGAIRVYHLAFFVLDFGDGPVWVA